jgi:hypothetical protein
MLIHETVTFAKNMADELRLIYDRFMAGQMNVDDFEDMYRSIMSQWYEITTAERTYPNFNQPYTLNDGTVIKNYQDRWQDRIDAVKGKVHFDIDPDFT